MENRVRRACLIVFGAAAGYAAAVAGLAETRDQVSYAASPARIVGQTTYFLAWLAMAVAGLTCVLAALIVTVSAVRWMRNTRRYRAMTFIALPPLAVVAALVSRLGLGLAAQRGLGGVAAGHSLFVAWLALAVLCAASCVYAAHGLLHYVELPSRVWSRIRLLTQIVMGAIGVGAAAMLAYLISLALVDDRLLSAHDGLLATPLLVTLVPLVVIGVMAAVVALLALRVGPSSRASAR